MSETYLIAVVDELRSQPNHRLELAKNLTDSLAKGHPWIYDRALAAPKTPIPAGALVEVVRGAFRVVGYYDPGSPIRVRVVHGREWGHEWARGVGLSAGRMRACDHALIRTNGIRAVHGEADGAPGLVIDVYDGHGVVVFDGPGAEAFWLPRVAAVVDGLVDGGVAIRSLWHKATRRTARGGRGLLGDPPPDDIEIFEDDARFAVDVRRGQKTGFFLDQRENRRIIGNLSSGATVLNLFSYTGGFSVHAALGGASRVTTVDIAAPAVEAAEGNFRRSGVDPGQHRFIAADVFDVLGDMAGRAIQFDVVVCDPPSFAPREKAKAQAIRAYRKLNAAAVKVVAGGGILLSASCSSHVSTLELASAVGDGARDAGRRLRLRSVLGAATDHPVLPAFPEGWYLSALVGYVD